MEAGKYAHSYTFIFDHLCDWLACCRRPIRSGPIWRDFHLHSHGCLGWRRAHLVRRGTSCAPLRHSCTRTGRGSCSPGHPCPDRSPQKARDALVRLVGNPTGVGPHGHIEVQGPAMTCMSDGSAGGSRTAAWCISPIGGDINCAMVRGGWAAKWDRYWGDHRCT